MDDGRLCSICCSLLKHAVAILPAAPPVSGQSSAVRVTLCRCVGCALFENLRALNRTPRPRVAAALRSPLAYPAAHWAHGGLDGVKFRPLASLLLPRAPPPPPPYNYNQGAAGPLRCFRSIFSSPAFQTLSSASSR
jgi:hypothetical protein